MVTKYLNAGIVQVEYMAVCHEKHKDTTAHYHASVKLTGVKKWSGIKMLINDKENVNLNFNEDSAGYLKAYRYIIKEDKEVYHSPGHPKNLHDARSPRTSKGMDACRKRRSSSSTPRRLPSSGGGETVRSTPPNSSALEAGPSCSSNVSVKAKVICLTCGNVSDIIFENKIKTLKQLYALANTRKEAGQCDLANFVLSKDDKLHSEMIRKTYLLKDAQSLVERQKLQRIEVVRKKAVEDCMADDCVWLQSAVEVLELNHIHPIVFATAIRDLIIQARGKYRNIMIVGERNCAKTFILKPLEIVCFLNPAKDKYPWVGVDECEIVLLQDFRWDSETIAWKNFLLLLEGETVKLPAPKNHFATDLCVSTDIPIFSTGKERIKYKGTNNCTDEIENKMMDCRWKIFRFVHEFNEENQKKIPPCGSCFCRLVLMGDLEQ